MRHALNMAVDISVMLPPQKVVLKPNYVEIQNIVPNKLCHIDYE